MRDAIVLSGWIWGASNVPERLARALACAGSRVLYCENPASFIRTVRRFSEVEKGVFAFGLQFFGHRLNKARIGRSLQTKLLARQILKRVKDLRLKDPVFVYPHGTYCLPLCREFKRQGFPLVHVCMDYELESVREHVRESNLTLVIPPAAFDELRNEFGQKVHLIPQFSLMDGSTGGTRDGRGEDPELLRIPRPRLGYLGNLTGRVSLSLLKETLSQHSEWHFLSFGTGKWLPLPNEHVLAWRSAQEVAEIAAGLDVGFMPYDCSIPKNLHCVPLKLFDYFAAGIPVVSTPITFLREYEDLVYIGNTAEEIANAISRALSEQTDNPKRAKRKAVAQAHSVTRSAKTLVSLLDSLDTQ